MVTHSTTGMGILGHFKINSMMPEFAAPQKEQNRDRDINTMGSPLNKVSPL